MTRGDQLYEAGDYDDAVGAYESQLLGNPSAAPEDLRALFHLGILHSLPDGPAFDPALADKYFRDLIERAPTSAWALQAGLLLEISTERTLLQAEVAAKGDRVSFLLHEVKELRRETSRVEDQASVRQDRIDYLFARIEELKREIATLADEVAQRELELERIKEIDLDPDSG